MKTAFLNLYKKISAGSIMLAVFMLVVVFVLAGCDMGPFAEEDELPTGLPEFEVPDLMLAYYDAIERGDPDLLAATLPEADEEIEISIVGDFYRRGNYDTVEYDILVEDYVGGYDNDYFERFDVIEVEVPPENRERIHIDDDDAEIEARVSKSVRDIEDSAHRFDMEYDLEMVMEYREDEYWVIVEIHKTDI